MCGSVRLYEDSAEGINSGTWFHCDIVFAGSIYIKKGVSECVMCVVVIVSLVSVCTEAQGWK